MFKAVGIPSMFLKMSGQNFFKSAHTPIRRPGFANQEPDLFIDPLYPFPTKPKVDSGQYRSDTSRACMKNSPESLLTAKIKPLKVNVPRNSYSTVNQRNKSGQRDYFRKIIHRGSPNSVKEK